MSFRGKGLSEGRGLKVRAQGRGVLERLWLVALNARFVFF